MLCELGMERSDFVGEETKRSTEEFCCFGFIDKDEGWAVFVRRVLEKYM